MCQGCRGDRPHRLIDSCPCLKPGEAKCSCGFRGELVAVQAHVEAMADEA